MLQSFKKLKQNDDGTTAVEFSLIAVPVILFTIGIIETSLMFATSTVLDGAVSQASRIIQTGALQQSGSENPEAVFRIALCNAAVILVNCDDIQLEVFSPDGNSFESAGLSDAQFDENGDLIPRDFNAGGIADVVVIRAVYKHPLVTPFIGNIFANASGNSRQFISTIVMETEPYDFESEEDA